MTASAYDQTADSEIDLSSLFSVLWRRKGWIILWGLVGVGLAICFLILVDPVYQSDARLLIEHRETAFTRPSDEQNIPAASNFDTLSVASQVEVLRSRGLLKTVAEKLDLANNPEFDPLLGGANGFGNPISSLMGLLGIKSGVLSDTREERILSSLGEKLEVYPVNGSRVISVEVTSQSPTVAANIANAISLEYLNVQRQDSRTSAKGASQFLDGEIGELRKRVADAERKVEDFRSSADLIAVDDDSTLTKQRLSESLTLLSDLNSQRGEAEAKADQIRRLINSGAALDRSSDVQGSPLIQRLREQQVALRARIVDLQTSLLPNHPQVQAARSQLADLETEIAGQALLIAQALEGDAEIAKVRQQELEREVARLKTATARANEQEIKLRALERDARAERDLLENYLTRFRESSARQNSELLPVNARIISKANVPIKRHFPKPGPTVMVASFAGVFLSTLFILVGELMSARPTGSRATAVPATADPATADPATADPATAVPANAATSVGDASAKPVANRSVQPLSKKYDSHDDDVALDDAAKSAPLVAPLSSATDQTNTSNEAESRAPSYPHADQATSGQSATPAKRSIPEHLVPMVENALKRDVNSPPVNLDPKASETANLNKFSTLEKFYKNIPPANKANQTYEKEAYQKSSENLHEDLDTLHESHEAGDELDADPLGATVDDQSKPESVDIDDLYSIDDAIDAIEKYQLEQIVVVPVFNDISCADVALDLSRELADRGEGVVFIDTTNLELDDHMPLAGMSDVMSGEAEIDEAIFSDPMSDVDLMASGSQEIIDNDWREGRTQNVLDTVSTNYDITVLHVADGVSVPYFDELIERSDMLIFAVDAPLSRRQVAEVLHRNLDKIPAHSMFVGFEDLDSVVSAA